LRGHREIGCCIVEPIVGREGVLLPPAGWLRRLAELCREHGVLLVADEIFTGLGRTGALWASEHEQVVPDLLCCGKALGGGLPIAATLARRELFSVWSTNGEARHTATFVAHPLACATALATLDLLQQEDLVARSRSLGEQIAPTLRRLATRCAVRGRGLLWGLETEHREQADAWAREALEGGVYVLAGGASGCVLQIAPPLTIPIEDLSAALRVLEETAPNAS
jgi:acetylornithine/succinyldiaminopimelate/putrescine aminotransferase